MDSIRLFKLKGIQLNEYNISEFEHKMFDWKLWFLKEFNVHDAKFESIATMPLPLKINATEKFLFYLNMGDYFFYKTSNNVLGAQDEYVKALELGRLTKNKVLICESLKKILELNKHSFLIDNSKAQFYLEIFRKNAYDDFERGNYLYYKLLFDFQYFKNLNWSKADEKELLLFGRETRAKFIKGRIHHLVASFYSANKGYDAAIEYIQKAIESFSMIQYNYKNTQLTNSKIALLRYLVLTNEFYKANDLQNNIEYSSPNALDIDNQRYLYFYKAVIDSANGNFFEAFNNLMNYNQASEKFLLRNNKRINDEMEAKYQTAEKEKQILKEQQKVRANRNWLIAAGIVLLLGSGIGILLQKNTTKKRLLAEQQALIKQERVDNLLKEQELVSIDAMIAGQEKERQRVANELHDDLGSLMATIKLHFDNSKVSKKDSGLQNAQKLLDQAYQKVRGMAHSKNSGVMSNQGLLPAIKKMAQVITETNALEVTVEDFGMGDRLENSLELNLFRMVQELVANAIKHAEATQVTIQLTQYEDNLNIIIEDNGKGFDRAKVDTSKTGMGLTTIEKRVEHLEGNFTVDSVLGKGTSILIDIPV